MKAVTYEGTKAVTVKTVDKPQIEEPTDVILKVTSSAICGSDLHMYDGRTGVERGKILGDEIMGVVDEIGDGELRVGQALPTEGRSLPRPRRPGRRAEVDQRSDQTFAVAQ